MNKKLVKLEQETVYTMEMILNSSHFTPYHNRISMIESELERYHKKRNLVTGRKSGEKNRARLVRYRSLYKENYKLRREIAEKNCKWWKFWW